ncbi:MAG: quinoprotein relay system zinc metallohydrolase 1 [Sterolibacteriaceae bacterium]|nr:quinoprotein relay system zinc metallohydrolase 1 [Candidatus Methylophosphatis haderslevensis]
MRWALLLLATMNFPIEAGLDYLLKPRRIAPDTYVFVGLAEDFSRSNGGNIVNTGFIVTTEGVLVIDTGSSRLYGEQMRRAIAAVTDQPVRQVLITHHHPDHYFGNQGFRDVPIVALAGSIGGMKQEGGAFADNLYRMAGDWMRDTEPLAALQEARPGRSTIGGHDIELIALKGHTQADLAVLDHTTGVLFAGDLVFWQRAATTPHAAIADWLAALDRLQALKWKTIVPGHGEPHADARGIAQTRGYLKWLDATLRQAAADGRDMPELLRIPLPAEFAGIALARQEFDRSIAHLYRDFEQNVLSGATRQ